MTNQIKNRASSLFKYIKSVLESNLKVNTNLSKLPLKKFKNDFIESEYIKTIFDNPTQKEFLIIKYPNIEAPPKYPKILEGYVQGYPHNPELSIEATDECKQVWNDFLPALQKWNSDNLEKLKVENLFRELYSLQSQRDESFEFVLGHGIIAWQTYKKVANQLKTNTINYPLITVELNVTYSATKKRLLIEPVEDKPFTLEDLVIQEYTAKLSEIKNNFENLEYDITDKKTYMPFFTNVLNNFVDPIDGNIVNSEIIEDEQNLPIKIDENLKLYDTWGIFYRKRRQNAELKDLENYIQIIENNDNIQNSSLAAFLDDPQDIPENFENVAYNETEILQNKEILFPLPFNEEQVNILNKIERQNNVIVLGPPGTGKSHTIANLISHFLAKGKRVLVTSQKDQALDVLLNKIPKDLRKFCIPILSNIPDGKRKMEEAFLGINQAITDSTSHLENEIEEINQSLDDTKNELIETQNKIKFVVKSQLNRINYNNKAYLPIELCQKLNKIKDRHSWLQDSIEFTKSENIDGVTTIKPIIPIDENELKRLIDLHLKLKNDTDDLKLKRISTNLLIDTKDFEVLTDNILKIQELDERINNCIPDLIIKNVQNAQVLEYIKLLSSKIENDKLIKHEWQKNLIKIIENETENNRIIEVNAILQEYISKIKKLLDEYDIFSKIETKTPFNLIQFQEFINKQIRKTLNGKNVYSLLNMLISPTKEKLTLKNTFIDSKNPQNYEDWQNIKRHIEIIEATENLALNWNKLAKRYKLPISDLEIANTSIEQNIFFNEYYYNEDSFNNIFQLVQELGAVLKYNSYNEDIKKISEKFIENADFILKQYSAENLLQSIKYKLNKDKYISSKTKEEELKLTLSNHLNNYYLSSQLYEALELIYKNPKEAILQWNKFYNRLYELETLEDDYNEYLKLFDKLKNSCPIWANCILENENSDFYPEWWQESFEFNALYAYISKINNLAINLNNLENKLTTLGQKLREKKEKLILKTTIKNIKANVTQKKLRALEEWELGLRKLGKGTGKNAQKRRMQVQHSMQQAKNAIPVWIMPNYKVSETIPSEIGIFDVVIIDEASQSDIRAFLSLARGKKVIIVGDPKQVSPISVGADDTQIQNKIQEYLSDIPLGKYFDLKTSIYDIAKATLGGSNVLMLKEHFRCLPEIIRFSNDLCYNGEIVPLRYVSPQDKLTPALESLYVQNGRRRDNCDINDNEAIKICKKIEAIVNDEKYNNKSIGIISLTGFDQARYIQSILSNYISADEQIERKIRIGDAAIFQGDERDIMILSMVVSPNDLKKYIALTQDMYIQRFNVALSRAKDKVILAHSIKLEEISNTNCLRYKLLEFINSGQIEDKRQKDKLLFDSDFEEVVYNSLVNKGYILTPQVQVGPYKIDLVVEGTNQKFGIECDGDKYHPPEKWLEDSLRQKQLERMGWTIYRIWGSDFYNRKNEIIEDIVKNLNSINIYPKTFENNNK